MRRLVCDLHVHSCLSPCGDDGMTPALAAGLLRAAGMDVAALTDHNSVRNCPAFFKAAREYGLSPLAGMELTTAEDIHLVCLSDTLERAFAFQEAVDRHRVLIRNKPQFFGQQLIMDELDNILGREEYLLPNATTLGLSQAAALARECGMVCYPAHVDREANGIIAVLGDFPSDPGFRFAEFREPEQAEDYRRQYPSLEGVGVLFGSDAHRPEAICDGAFALEAEDDGDPAQAIFRLLGGGG